MAIDEFKNSSNMHVSLVFEFIIVNTPHNRAGPSLFAIQVLKASPVTGLIEDIYEAMFSISPCTPAIAFSLTNNDKQSMTARRIHLPDGRHSVAPQVSRFSGSVVVFLRHRDRCNFVH